MGANLLAIDRAYRALVQSAAIDHDEIQAEIIADLDALKVRLEAQKPASGLSRLWAAKPEPIRGLYIHGSVGRGKSFLMDMFFDHLEIEDKRRVHFHEFMDEMHSAIARFRAEQSSAANNDPVAGVVSSIVKDTRVLCFDEFHVTDITNAMLLGRLFSQLWGAGIVIVATSNVAPDDLYRNGLNRDLILPFIAELKQKCRILQLDGPTDYRREKISGQPIFYFGDLTQNRQDMDRAWHKVTGGQPTPSGSFRSLGREIAVPFEGMGAARFSFSALCDNPLSTRDYLALSLQYHTIMVDDVPQFTRENSNAAKRFIQLIDTFYERSIKLLASFSVPLDQLAGDADTAFEFQRCISRLIEMQSEDYLSREVAQRANS